jgi:hypothetical protein
MMDAPNNASSEPHRATTITTMPLQNVSSNFLVVTTTNNNDSSGGGKTAYELERDRKVSENQARMRALGIDAARERIEIANAKKKTSKRSNDIWSKKRKSAVHVASSPRVTRRQRMMSNETEEEREAREAAERTQRELNGYYDDEQKQRTKAMVKTRGLEFPRVKEEFPNSLGMFGPFAMKTAKTNGPVTVLAVGAPVTGGRRRFESDFWSRTGCLYHHPYLIGYKAEKVFQGRAYVMEIIDGEDRPMFRVTDKEAPARTFLGETPTAPWYDLVISKRLGTRISGPQFFGFSERMTMAAIGFELERRGEEEMLKQCYSKGYAMDDERE